MSFIVLEILVRSTDRRWESEFQNFYQHHVKLFAPFFFSLTQFDFTMSPHCITVRPGGLSGSLPVWLLTRPPSKVFHSFIHFIQGRQSAIPIQFRNLAFKVTSPSWAKKKKSFIIESSSASSSRWCSIIILREYQQVSLFSHVRKNLLLSLAPFLFSCSTVKTI